MSDVKPAIFLDIFASYMVGDKVSDIECGWNAGVKCSVLVRPATQRTRIATWAGAGPLAVIDSIADLTNLRRNLAKRPNRWPFLKPWATSPTPRLAKRSDSKRISFKRLEALAYCGCDA